MSALALRVQPFCFLLIIFIQCIQGLLPLATTWITKGLFDILAQSLRSHPSADLIQHLCFLLIGQALIFVCSGMISPVYQYFNAELARALTLTMKGEIYRKAGLIGLAYFEDPEFHDLIQIASSNAQFGPLQALENFALSLQGTITLLSFLGVLITLSPPLTGIVVLAVLPQLYAQLKLGNQRVEVALINSPRERLAAYYGQVLSTMSFAKEVRLFNLGNYFLGKFLSTTREIYQAQRLQQRRALGWQATLALVAALVSTTAFVVVILQAFSGLLSLGDVALYTGAVASVQIALASLVSAVSRSNESARFFQQYTRLLALEQPLVVCHSPRPIQPLTHGITLHDVSFRYSEQHPWTLRKINLFLPAQKCLALVGLNGAGKTTLVKLLSRLYDPTEGKILWDGIAHVMRNEVA
jgi:ATP-binding cassette subfamily B protein